MRTVHNDQELDTISAHSVIVLDNLNLVPETAVSGVARVEVQVPASGDFWWGRGGDVKWDLEPGIDSEGNQRPVRNVDQLPVEIERWAIVDAASGERGYGRVYPGPAPADPQTGEPTILYWTKILDNERYAFQVRPAGAGEKLAIYARIPKFDRIDRGVNYELDPGRGEYLMTMLAIAVAPVFGYPVPPSIYTRAQAAQARLTDLSALSREAGPTTPDWQIGSWRFGLGRGGGLRW